MPPHHHGRFEARKQSDTVHRSQELKEEIMGRYYKSSRRHVSTSTAHLDSLKGKKSPNAIGTALKRLPHGSKAYHNAYNDAMKRIEGQLQDEEVLAKQVLSWITCAKRPLTTSELEHAIAAKPGISKLDIHDICPVEDMVSVCAGLVTVDAKGGIVRLVHYTTQEFFDSTTDEWFPNVQTDITKICATYLSFHEFEIGPCRDEEIFEERLEPHRLYEYASRYWGHHARDASAAIPEVFTFLERKSLVEASSQALLFGNFQEVWADYVQQYLMDITALHLTAYFGMEKVAKELLTGSCPEFKDFYDRTPLSWAAQNGNQTMVKLLLDPQKVDVDSKDSNNSTPLSYAAAIRDEAIVKLLLDTQKVDVDSKDSDSRTPLSLEAAIGYEAIVKLLLDTQKVDVDSKDSNNRTSQSYAAAIRYEAIVKLLLDTQEVDVDSKDKVG